MTYYVATIIYVCLLYAAAPRQTPATLGVLLLWIGWGALRALREYVRDKALE